jgi:hypothetical protein
VSPRHFERASANSSVAPPHAYVMGKHVERTRHLLINEPRLSVEENRETSRLQQFESSGIGLPSTYRIFADCISTAPVALSFRRRDFFPSENIAGAPDRNQTAMNESKIMHPNDDVGMNGQIGLPQK